MSEAWEHDLEESREAFVDLVTPVIEEWTGGELVNIESVTETSVANKLDSVAGVDAWDFDMGSGVRGVASRVQFDYPYDTFTIRKSRGSGAETEFDKRLRQINNGLLKVDYTVQAYVARNAWRLDSVAKVKTEPLIKFIEDGKEGTKTSWYEDGYGEGDYWTQSTFEDGHQEFYCVDWNYLRDQGVGVRISRPYRDPDDRVPSKKQSGLSDFKHDRDIEADGGEVCSRCYRILGKSTRICPGCGNDRWEGSA